MAASNTSFGLHECDGRIEHPVAEPPFIVPPAVASRLNFRCAKVSLRRNEWLLRIRHLASMSATVVSSIRLLNPHSLCLRPSLRDLTSAARKLAFAAMNGCFEYVIWPP